MTRCYPKLLSTGVWKDKSELENLREVGKRFYPDLEMKEKLLAQMEVWERALKRFTEWHPKKKGTKNKDSS